MTCSRQYLTPLLLYIVVFVVLLVTIELGARYLFAVLLFFPFLDSKWRLPHLAISKPLDMMYLATGVLSVSLLLFLNSSLTNYFFLGLIFTALPEEWFFRGYLLTRIGNGWRANLVSSIGFSVLHMFSQGFLMGLLIMGPSLFYGWVYQKTNNIYYPVLLHALSNLVFMAYIKKLMSFGI